jgi:hypothetical protein
MISIHYSCQRLSFLMSHLKFEGIKNVSQSETFIKLSNNIHNLNFYGYD